ncbi:MAG TPA: HlyD family efflux transporter periplasmic adaptor subunit [Polyangiaceae bacterium]|nr:HlyD family efflux transporter periplasmic adaptor subunit [Polyangiaceae bacterium]
MTRAQVRRSIWLGVGFALVALLAWALRPEPLLLEAASVTRGTLRSTVNGEGRTRVKALYVLAAPVDGEMERLVLEAGAEVLPTTVVARIRPTAPRPLDLRSRAQSFAAASAARQSLAGAEAAEQEAEVGLEHVASKFARTKQLVESGALPKENLEHGAHELQLSRHALDSARALTGRARAELLGATAMLAPVGRASPVALEVNSPAPGRLLRVLHESAGPVTAGTPLLEIGDIKNLEIVAELLSSDAALVRAGAPAILSGWGADKPISARVRRVDAAGFTKVSALGLEEQRVRVVLELEEPPPSGLGHDYRVEVSIVVWEGKNVLRVPSTALFRDGNRWAAFAIRNGRAHLTHVETGASDGAWTLVRSGLVEREQVIPQPSDALEDGRRVGVLREVETTQAP